MGGGSILLGRELLNLLESNSNNSSPANNSNTNSNKI